MQTNIPRLASGGMITNYYCTSRCRHCAYFCSPSWDKNYMTGGTAAGLLDIVKAKGCRSLHIGGGEPLLDPESLLPVLEEFRKAGVSVDYIETNSSWFKPTTAGREEAEKLLLELQQLGVSTLLISISPFHNEYIPFLKVEGVLEACRKTGTGIFPWVDSFRADLKHFDSEKTHSLDEYSEEFGPDYIPTIPNRYWVSFRGRALQTYKPYMQPQPYTGILKQSPGPCRELYDVSHFHVDLFGNYIPGLCTGLSIAAADLQGPVSSETYPFISALMTEGIAGLAELTVKDYGFQPKEEYVSKCDLCYDIRKYLVTEKGIDSPDLQPAEYYRQAAIPRQKKRNL